MSKAKFMTVIKWQSIKTRGLCLGFPPTPSLLCVCHYSNLRKQNLYLCYCVTSMFSLKFEVIVTDVKLRGREAEDHVQAEHRGQKHSQMLPCGILSTITGPVFQQFSVGMSHGPVGTIQRGHGTRHCSTDSPCITKSDAEQATIHSESLVRWSEAWFVVNINMFSFTWVSPRF